MTSSTVSETSQLRKIGQTQSRSFESREFSSEDIPDWFEEINEELKESLCWDQTTLSSNGESFSEYLINQHITRLKASALFIESEEGLRKQHERESDKDENYDNYEDDTYVRMKPLSIRKVTIRVKRLGPAKPRFVYDQELDD